MSNRGLKEISPGLMRWKGFYLIGAAGVAFWLYLGFIFDGHLKHWLEQVGTNINGATVSIRSLRTSLFSCDVELEGIEVAHHVRTMRNLFVIDRVHLDFLLAPIFQKKIIIEKMEVQGIQYGAPRSTSGLLPPEELSRRGAPGIIDRVASGFFAEIRNELSANPLRHLGRLATGIDIHAKLDAVRGEFQTIARLKEQRKALTTYAERWEKAVVGLPTESWYGDITGRIRDHGTSRDRAPAAINAKMEELKKVKAEIESEHKRLEAISKPLRAETDALFSDFTEIDRWIDKDSQLLREKLGLPRMDFDDLTRLLLGPKVLNYLERLTYWIDLTRRRMPMTRYQDQILMVAQQRDRGMSIHFGKMSTLPALLIRNVVITSDPSADSPWRGKVRGTVEGITSDPPIYGKPARFTLEADFPANGIQGVRANATVDHTQDFVNEVLDLEIRAFPLESWLINETSDLKVAIGKARGSLRFDATFDENDLDARWKLTAEDVDYAVTARHRQTEMVLRQIVDPIYAFTLTGQVNGTFDDLKLGMTSEMGKRLADGLRREYRHQIAAIDDNLRVTILDHLESQKQEFFHKFADTRGRTLTVVETALARIQELTHLTDEAMKRMTAREPRSTKHGSRAGISASH